MWEKMKNTLIPVCIRPNILSDDKITVGMFGISDNSLHFAYSEDKVKKAGSFLDKWSSDYLINFFKELNSSLELKNRRNGSHELFESYMDEKYFNYLSTYSKGLIHFGSPKAFSAELTKEAFDKAFTHFVGIRSLDLPEKKKTFRKIFDSFLTRESFKKVDTKYTLDPRLITGIFAPHKIDFIGVNGSPYAGIGVDFTNSPADVDKILITFNLISDGLKSLSKSKDLGEGVYEVYFNEPLGSENRTILDEVRKNNTLNFKMVEIDKIGKAMEKIDSGHYIKFSESVLID